MNQRSSPRTAAFVPLLVAAAILAGCRDGGADPPPAENLALNVVAVHDHAAAQKTSHQALVITSAKVLIRDIRFKSSQSNDSTDVAAGSMVLDLRLDGGVTEVLVTRISPGMYDRIRFTIHKPEDFEIVGDPEFRDGPSGPDRYSVVVRGLYHDTPFTYRSREDARQELLLNTPVSVTENGRVSLTIRVEPYEWFTDGLLVLDPFTQSGLIDNRIRRSFGDAYRDANRDGSPD